MDEGELIMVGRCSVHSTYMGYTMRVVQRGALFPVHKYVFRGHQKKELPHFA